MTNDGRAHTSLIQKPASDEQHCFRDDLLLDCVEWFVLFEFEHHVSLCQCLIVACDVVQFIFDQFSISYVQEYFHDSSSVKSESNSFSNNIGWHAQIFKNGIIDSG